LPEIVRSVVLGIVQGATEFLPVSSSGHLVIVPWLLGWPQSSLLLDTVLHWGTLLAILLVFWRDFVDIASATVRSILLRSLADPNARLGWFILIGSIPAAVLGLLFKDFFEMLFGSPRTAGFFLMVTGGLLSLSEVLARRIRAATPLERINLRQVLVIGSAQALALAPGISRNWRPRWLRTVRKWQRICRFCLPVSSPAPFSASWPFASCWRISATTRCASSPSTASHWVRLLCCSRSSCPDCHVRIHATVSMRSPQIGRTSHRDAVVSVSVCATGIDYIMRADGCSNSTARHC
jgi:hypothetical protein